MLKIYSSPYLIGLGLLWLLTILQLAGSAGGERKTKAFTMASLIVLLGITLLSTPYVDSVLSAGLQLNDAYGDPCPADKVDVLAGGYYESADPEEKMLVGETALRVIKGVEVFKKCHANTLIMSGGTSLGTSAIQGELMRDLAVKMGVPGDRVVLESESTDTREHPIYLCKSGDVAPSDRMAIVTSPWHQKRAMREFRRYFQNVRPVAAYDGRAPIVLSAGSLVPQATVLDESVRMISEYIGALWYSMLGSYPYSGGASDCHQTASQQGIK